MERKHISKILGWASRFWDHTGILAWNMAWIHHCICTLNWASAADLAIIYIQHSYSAFLRDYQLISTDDNINNSRNLLSKLVSLGATGREQYFQSKLALADEIFFKKKMVLWIFTIFVRSFSIFTDLGKETVSISS